MKTKLLHTIHSLAGGGAERQLQLLADGIDKTRFDVELFCINKAGTTSKTSDVELIVAKAKNLFSIAYLKEFWNVLKAREPDVVHVWVPATVSIPAMFFSFLQGRKVVFSYRNRMRFNRGIHYLEFLTALICADRIVSNHRVTDSNRLYRWLYKLKKGCVIKNAVIVPDRVRELIAPSHHDKTRFVFLGRLTAQKNPLALVRALAEMRDVPGWGLEIYGKGEFDQDIRDVILYHGLADKIVLKGFTDEPLRVMQEADCLIFPSIYEGMSNVLVDAFAAGLPVIASTILANKNLVEDADAVIWIDPFDPGSIRAGVKTFMKMGAAEKAEKIRNARQIATHYDAKKMIRAYESFYASL